MEFAPQTPGKPREQSLGEPLVQTTISASGLNIVLRRVSVAHETFKNKELVFAVFYWTFVI